MVDDLRRGSFFGTTRLSTTTGTPLRSLIWPEVTTMSPSATPFRIATWSPRVAPVVTKTWRA